jgi:outer membrane receptor for ferrienterochelin and colicins
VPGALVALLAIAVLLATGRSGAATIAGTVVDTTAHAPVEGALIHALSAAVTEERIVAASAVSDAHGHFRLGSLASGSYFVVASRIGMERSRLGPFLMAAEESLDLEIPLLPGLVRMNPVVVTASRRQEKSLAAPASVTVISARAIQERPAVTPVAHVRAVAGLDIAAKGLTQATVVARGFNGAQSPALLVLEDYRYASIPSLRYNLFHFIPAANEDMQGIEVVRGPGAAIYGPNCDRGVVHILTRSPFEAPGTAVSLVMGERDVTQGSVRHAGLLGRRWGYKITGQYFRGWDWPASDAVEDSNRSAAIAAGADPKTLRVGARDSKNERAAGEMRLEWRADPATTVVGAAGVNQAIRNVDVIALGAVQVERWRSSYAQLRGSRGRLFAQAFVNASDAGDTYFLRNGHRIVDESRLWVAQVQHGIDTGARQRWTYGVDAQWTDPRTNGTIMGRNENGDRIRELGAYLHSETKLRSNVDLVSALRIDDHSRFQDPVLSPRVALVAHPREQHNVRLTYNRAFGTPATDDLFADLVIDSLGPLPFGVRAEGVPETGYTFRRESGRASMRSPFTPSSAGGPTAYLPPDATLLWDAMVAIVDPDGTYGLSAVPPPTAANVSSLLRILNANGGFDPVLDVSDIPVLRPTITNSFEIGYRGLIGERIRVAADGYRTWIENFIGHLRVITPNVFLEQATLSAYLAQYMSPGAADSLAQRITQVPLGTITPEQARDPADVILAVRNFGTVALWGADFSLGAELSDRVSLAGTFSWVSRDLFLNLDGIENLALNAPARKGTISVAYRDPIRGLTGEVRFRSAASFPVLSGVYAGTIESYSLVDCGVGVRLSTTPNATLTVTAENILDRRHQEFLGAPRIGRLVLARIGAEF